MEKREEREEKRARVIAKLRARDGESKRWRARDSKR
jgi:hypothetical protein